MIVLADLSTTSSKHMFLFSTAPPFYNTTSAMPIMLHLQRTAARYMCWGYTLLWGHQICPLGIPHGTGSFRDSPCSSCNVLWHVLPGEVCKSRYLSCWYLLSVLLQLVRVGVGRAPVMGCQHMQQFILLHRSSPWYLKPALPQAKALASVKQQQQNQCPQLVAKVLAGT